MMAIVAAFFVEFAAAPIAIYNSFFGFFLDFTSTCAVENCIATPCWFHSYDNVFIFSHFVRVDVAPTTTGFFFFE